MCVCVRARGGNFVTAGPGRTGIYVCPGRGSRAQVRRRCGSVAVVRGCEGLSLVAFADFPDRKRLHQPCMHLRVGRAVN